MHSGNSGKRRGKRAKREWGRAKRPKPPPRGITANASGKWRLRPQEIGRPEPLSAPVALPTNMPTFQPISSSSSLKPVGAERQRIKRLADKYVTNDGQVLKNGDLIGRQIEARIFLN